MKKKNVVFHIGMMKTATTYFQNIVSNNREALASQGWVYPGTRLNHQSEIYTLCGTDISWRTTEASSTPESDQFVRDLSDTNNNRLVSSEALANLTEQGIENLLSSISAPTSVIISMRPLTTIVPSAWQQSLKGGSKSTIEDYAERFIQSFEAREGSLYRTYAFGAAAQRWHNVAKASIKVIRIGSGDTWGAFRKACELPSVEVLEVPSARRNIALSVGVCEIVRRYNEKCQKNGTFDKRRLDTLISCFMEPPEVKLDEKKPTLPQKYLDTLERLEKAEWDTMSAIGVKVYNATTAKRVRMSLLKPK
ncbi:hypothetical protein [Falsiruegeria mediterranea]|uniref:Uncharacterized protein n=1 Tax=Falsiruegeria mediterranea M17 TaxID=1200281 RepID=A0A2R8CFW6_9RHOB|nr:hypothetical protein [Falsiruegeria mediterranea]SPJ31297.1 hypothetical protein TRM7615_04840 [Falsiruegeria mediterranea M17]